jgi:hypothetical protein
MKPKHLSLFFATILSAAGLALGILAIRQFVHPPPIPSVAKKKSVPAIEFGTLPIAFEANQGQTESSVRQDPGNRIDKRMTHSLASVR